MQSLPDATDEINLNTPNFRRKRDARLAEKREQKWDWDVIFGLYMNGLEVADILKIPDFKGLGKSYLSQRIYTEGWAKKRARFQATRSGAITQGIQDQIKGAINEHYVFMLEELHLERELYRQRTKSRDIDSQRERLDVIVRLETLARKVLGLDDQKPGDPSAIGFAALVNVNVRMPSRLEDPASAILTLGNNKNALAGRTDARNGTTEVEDDTPTAQFRILDLRDHISPNVTDAPPTESPKPDLPLVSSLDTRSKEQVVEDARQDKADTITKRSQRREARKGYKLSFLPRKEQIEAYGAEIYRRNPDGSQDTTPIESRPKRYQ